MKCSFSDDPGLREPLFELLDEVFPGLRTHARRIETLGVSWESVSTPFVHWAEGRPVSHVGLIGLSLMMLGRQVPVGTIHAVATHPDHRRRGCYRRLMEEVIDDSKDRYETLILTTEHPEYFEPFGFRYVQEHRFVLDCRSTSRRKGFRSLQTQDAADVALLHRLLETREPVSRVLGVVNEKAVFCFNEAHRPLRYAQDLDLLVCMELEGKRLRLFDLVGPRIPPLNELLERIADPIEEVTMHFAPDRLAAGAPSTPYLLDHDGPSYLMVRGVFAPEGHRFTLPRSART